MARLPNGRFFIHSWVFLWNPTQQQTSATTHPYILAPPVMAPPRAPKMQDVAQEISRWESLLAQEGDTRWESFTKAAFDGEKNVTFMDGSGGIQNATNFSARGMGHDVSVNEQMTATMEQLIEKNIQLTEELAMLQERSERELSVMEENAVREKRQKEACEATLLELRMNVGDFMAVPSDAKKQSAAEQSFWEALATPSLLSKSEPTSYFGEEQSTRQPPGKIVLPLSSKETDNFRAKYQRIAAENEVQREEIGKLKRINETRRPMISRLSATAKNQVGTHKRQLMAAVRRIDYLVAERDEAVKKCEQMKKYVNKLEIKALKVGGGKPQSSAQRSATTTTTTTSTQGGMFRRIGGSYVDQSCSTSRSTSNANGSGIMGKATRDHVGKNDIARLYAAASERSRKQGVLKGTEEHGGYGGGGVTEGRRKLELARRPKNSATLAVGGTGERGRGGERSLAASRARSTSPGMLEEALLESVMMDEEGVEADGVEEATLRLQQNFSAMYSEGSKRGREVEGGSDTVPLPAER